MKYSDKFKDPRWQKKRLEIFNRDDFKCQSCGEDEKQLHAHHLCYIKGYEPWEYDNIFLVTLCEDCHTAFHENPINSEYFLLKSFNDAQAGLMFADDQKYYDIGGLMRFIGKEEINIDEKHFKMCKVERTFNKKDASITFKLIEETCECEPFQSCEKCAK